MPFTLAHPAAALPLAPLLGRFGVRPALVIGSMTPDLFLAFPLFRADTHAFGAIFWFCLPLGLTIHALLCLGRGLFRRWRSGPVGAARATGAAPAGHAATHPWIAVTGATVSVLCGALTHLIWDSLTHGDGLFAAGIPWLGERLEPLSGHPRSTYRVLQHGSSVLGLTCLAWWALRASPGFGAFLRTKGRSGPPSIQPITARGPATD